MRIKEIQIAVGKLTLRAQLNDSATATKICDALPIQATADRWGDEVYFEIPVRMEAENPKSVVETGELGYWPEGEAFCIFFGPTPISKPGEIRPASPVNPVGRLLQDPKVLKEVRPGDTITISKI